MKFEQIVMNNFMRYKGRNEIAFSCNDEKNVTIILGDNTVGKTTIAQAFRWCLYGAVMIEREKKQEDYQLLNNEILSKMDADSRVAVNVELTASDEEKIYVIYREIEYVRIYPKLLTREANKKVIVKVIEDGTLSGEIEGNKAEELINELFPKSLSHYFLFDGERWGDVSINGVKEDIKKSVHTLTGLSAYQAAKWHLKEMGSNSVIRKFKSKISGSGNLYDELAEECKRIEKKMQGCQEQIKIIDINIGNCQKKYNEIEKYLQENKNTEEMQRRYRQLGVIRESQKKRMITEYQFLVNRFSERAYMLFAEPMIKAALDMVKSVAGERRDIPHMHQTTIDYIINRKVCICGNAILPKSRELESLMEQRRYLPPADIGSLLGEFERTADWWKRQTEDTYKELKEYAVRVDDSRREYEETCNQGVKLEQQMEERVDFAEKRRQQRRYQQEMQELSISKGTLQGQIQALRHQKENIEEQMKHQEAKTEENQRWRKRLELAEILYQRMHEDFQQQEKKIFQELNEQIQYNFERMFNAKDKRVELTEKYDIQMFNKTDSGYMEEKNLSEGEKIARNFAFIVTIMDYSRRKKAERQENSMKESDTLPIVLDGPFSKLGDENIELIAKVLPEVSEQVIIFMLKKDWSYTKLDKFVGASYVIEKKPDKSYASIKKAEVE